MCTLNIRGALVLALLFTAMACAGSWYLPSDTDVHFSAESGFYDDPVTLEMSCEVPGAVICYTTDGSVPTAESLRYSDPILLESVVGEPNRLSEYTGVSHEDFVPEDSMVKASVIRAAVFRSGKQLGDVHSAAYFVGVDRAWEYGDVPIVSLIMDEDDLFDHERGVYILGAAYDEWLSAYDGDESAGWDFDANFFQRGREAERPVHVDFLCGDGSVGFSQDMGLRIKGGVTRAYRQKSLRLIARDEYGDDRVHYPLFGEENEHKQFVLRSGGNDASYAKIRDPLVQSLASSMRMGTQRSAPCIVFINGEYWGLYSLTEQHGEHYIEAAYGIEKDNAVIIKAGELEAGVPEDMALYEDMLWHICLSDMTVPENYQKASELLDMGSFADYTALQVYVDNADGFLTAEKNWQMWRARTMDSSREHGDGRFRMMLYDADYCADLYATGEDENEYLSHALFDAPSEEDSALLPVLRSLYQNENFRRELVNSLCDVRNIHFAPDRLTDTLDELRSVYEPLMPDTFRRFGPQEVLDFGAEEYIAYQMDRLGWYFEDRWEDFPELVQSALDLSDPAECTLMLDGDGSVMVNHSVPDLWNDYTGLYFPDYPITLTAQETGEDRFVRWEYEGCTLSDPASPVTEVYFDGDFSVTAIFE